MNNDLHFDSTFIAAFNERSEDAFVTVYNIYYPLLVRRAVQRTMTTETAEDLVQDIFTQLYIKRSVSTNIEGYLFTALERKIYDYWRHEIVHDRYMQIMRRVASIAENNASSGVELKELQKNIEQQIEKLPPQCQRIFRLKRERFLTNKEIAEQLDISVKTVEAQMSKALYIIHSYFSYEKVLLLLMVTETAKHIK